MHVRYKPGHANMLSTYALDIIEPKLYFYNEYGVTSIGIAIESPLMRPNINSGWQP